MDKSRIRSDVLHRRLMINFQDATLANQQIRTALWSHVNWNTIRSMHIYTSRDELNEVDTHIIRQKISESFPSIAITQGNPSRHALIPTDTYDLIIVPLVAFDSACHRIGFGSGWYDRFLNLQPNAKKIGLAYEAQYVEAIPVEAHDETLDMIVTETGIYSPNKNALLK